MADHSALSVLFLSVVIFLFFKFCIGAENSVGDDPYTPPGAKCPTGTEYSVQRRECKDLVMSNKSLSERMLLLLPYFLKGLEGSR